MIGRTISHYKILSKLGEGGMGVVYKAEDLTLGRTVALKFLPPDSVAIEDDRARLVHEARAAAALLHPNICPVYEIAEAEGRIFIAMACIEGRSLKDRIAEGPLPLSEALSIARQIGEAVAAAHAKGIIHRDIKPGNVMVFPDGRPVLMDFGLAKVSGTTKLTRTGTTMGTVAYMSPEQVQGRVVDHRADIWALGVVLYEMVSGKVPFGGEYEAALLYSILNEDPESLSGEGKEVPAGLDGIIAKALEKDPGKRYQQAQEFVAHVAALAQDSQVLPAGKARPAKGLKRLWRRWRPWERAAAVCATCIVLTAIAYGMVAVLSPKSEAIDSIGFIPLQNLSGDAKGDLWADGVTERLSASMGAVAALNKIVSDQTMKQFKGSKEPASVIGHKVGAKALVGGSLMLIGDQVQITIKLYEASKDRQIWSNIFSGATADIMVLQSEIVRAIAQNLKAKLTSQGETPLVSAKPVNPQAYEIYLQGRRFLMDYQNVKAEECFRRAVAIDSNMAIAWAGLARSYERGALFSEITPAQAAPLAWAALKRALALDEQQAETQAALGALRLNFNWDWAGADSATKRAYELNPNSPEVVADRREYVWTANRMEEAIALQRQLCDLQPLSPEVIGDMGFMYFYAGRYDDAIAEYRKADEMREYRGLNGGIGLCYLFKGMHKEALAQCDDTKPVPSFEEAYIYAKLGRCDKTLAFIAAEQRRLETGKPFNPWTLAAVSAGLGNKDEAFAWLQRSLQERWPEVLQSPIEPYYENLHSDPRWQELLRAINYPGTR
jgi:TolB-like protein/predicted Ser/Thr protein kinase